MTEIRCAVEIREDADRTGPGRLVGTLLKYGERATDRPEVFEPGALRWPDNGIPVTRQHVRSEAVVRAVPEVRGDAVVIDVPLPDTQRARDVATEIRSGLLTGLSVEFSAVRARVVGGVRRISEAVLGGAGVVDSPAYAGSGVEVRHAAGRRRRRWR